MRGPVKIVQLGDLALEDSGMVDGPFGSNLKASEYVENGVPIIRLQNIKRGNFLEKEIRFVTPSKALQLHRHSYRPSDVVIAKLGECGAACVVPLSAGEGVIVADVVRFRGAPSKIDHKFLVHFLNSDQTQQQVAALTKGTTRARVNLSDFKRIEVPVPPLSEQRRIADILDKADSIRRKRKEAIALTEELLRSAFLEMFGDPVSNPKGWEVRTIDELRAKGEYTCVGGPFGSNLTSRDYVEAGVPVIRGTNLGAKSNTFVDEGFVFVTETKAEDLVQNMAYPGDLVFTQRGTLGQVAMIPLSAKYRRYVVSQSQMKLTPNAELVAPWYLHQYFCSDRLQEYILAHALVTGVPHINLGILRKIPVVCPPMKLQRAFVRVAQGIASVRGGIGSALAEDERLFQGLVANCFRAEV